MIWNVYITICGPAVRNVHMLTSLICSWPALALEGLVRCCICCSLKDPTIKDSYCSATCCLRPQLLLETGCWLYVCMYICIYIHIYIYLHVYMYILICVCVCIYVCMYICMKGATYGLWPQLLLNDVVGCMYACIYVYIYVYM